MKVFISHSQQDKELAKKVAASLESAGLEVWDAENEILPGDNWAEKVARALRESEAMVVLLSKNALKSDWVRREIEYALGEKRYNKRLISVLVGPTEKKLRKDIPWILKRLKMIELQDANKEEDIKQIAKAIIDTA